MWNKQVDDKHFDKLPMNLMIAESGEAAGKKIQKEIFTVHCLNPLFLLYVHQQFK